MALDVTYDRTAGRPWTLHRADVVGSLLRPEALRRARSEKAPREQLTPLEDEAVRGAIALQRECGLEVVTDGEMRRGTYTAPLSEGLEGVAEVEGRYKTWRDVQGNEHRVRQKEAVVGKVALRESVAAAEYRYARTVSDVPVKVTIPSPLSLFTRWDPRFSTDAYPDPYELFADTATILRGIVAELIDLGCRYIQFDAPELTAVLDSEARAGMESLGLSHEEFLDTGCRLLNELADVGRDDVRFAVHLCRGNNRGMYLKSGGYERMVATFYERAPRISTLMLEFDDERSGGFEPLEGAPEDKVMVLGLISTKTPRLEDRTLLVRRIEQAARRVPLEQLALSTQCGFSSADLGGPMNEAEQRRKLELVTSVAREVWG